MMGLDNAGKSTALYRMRTGQYCETIPTIGFNCEKVKGKMRKSKDIVFTIWDVGGQDRVRPLWRTYARGAEGIMFVLDAADHATLEEAKLELIQIFKQPETRELPILILANKQDMPDAHSHAYLTDYLLEGTVHYSAPSSTATTTATATTKPTHVNDQVRIVAACAITGDGLDESLDQLYEMIVKKAKVPSKSSSSHHHHPSKRFK